MHRLEPVERFLTIYHNRIILHCTYVSFLRDIIEENCSFSLFEKKICITVIHHQIFMSVAQKYLLSSTMYV